MARSSAQNASPSRAGLYQKRASKRQLDWTRAGSRRWSRDVICASGVYCLSPIFPALVGGQAPRPRGMRARPTTRECARARTASAIEGQCDSRHCDLWRTLYTMPSIKFKRRVGGVGRVGGLGRVGGSRHASAAQQRTRTVVWTHGHAHAHAHMPSSSVSPQRSDPISRRPWWRRGRKIASPFRSRDSNRQPALAADGRGAARLIVSCLFTTFTRASVVPSRPEERIMRTMRQMRHRPMWRAHTAAAVSPLGGQASSGRSTLLSDARCDARRGAARSRALRPPCPPPHAPAWSLDWAPGKSRSGRSTAAGRHEQAPARLLQLKPRPARLVRHRSQAQSVLLSPRSPGTPPFKDHTPLPAVRPEGGPGRPQRAANTALAPDTGATTTAE